MNRGDAPSRALPVEPDAQPLAALIARVEAATGPDRSIDRALAFRLEGTGVEKERKLYADMGDSMWVPGANGLTPYDIARGDCIRREWQQGSRGRRGSYMPVRWMNCDGPRPLTNCEAFTASLDAALALVGRVLPEWTWSVGNLKSGAQAYLMRDQGGALISGAGATPALALALALLRALQAQPNQHNARDGSSPQSNDPST